MKTQIISLMVALFTAVPFMSCADDKIIDKEQLPVAAKQFINDHFNQGKIVQVKKDVDDLKTHYEVIFASNYEIKFDKNGNWLEIDGNGKEIPKAIIPPKILEYIGQNYADYFAKEIKFEHKQYEVKMSNGIELKFDKDGNFLRLDN